MTRVLCIGVFGWVGLVGCRPVQVRPPPPIELEQTTPSQALARYLAGRLAMERGELSAARVALESAAALDPSAARIEISLGEVCWRQEDTAGAALHWGRAVALDPGQAAGWAGLGQASERAGQSRVAAQQLGRALDAGADWTVRVKHLDLLRSTDQSVAADAALAAWVTLPSEERMELVVRSQRRADMGDARGAMVDLTRVLEGRLDDPRVLDLYLSVSRAARSPGPALDLLERLIRYAPGEADVLVRHRDLALEVGDPHRALVSLRALDALGGHADPGLQAMIVDQLIASGDAAGALVEADALLKRAPEFPEIDLLRARALLGLSRPADALIALGKGGEGRPPLRRLTVQLQALRALGDQPAAAAAIGAWEAEGPVDQAALRVIAAHWLAVGELDRADQVASRWIAGSPERLTVWQRRVADSGHVERALSGMEAAVLEVGPTSTLLQGGAAILIAAGQPKAALAALDGAPDEVDTLRLRAHAWQLLGRADAALAAMDAVLAAEPDDASALNFTGYTLAEQGVDLQRALGLAQRALEIRPADAAIMDTVGWILLKTGRVQEARLQLETAALYAPHDAVIAGHLSEAQASR